MAKFLNVYPGTLILPNGDKIEPRQEVDLSKDATDNAGVKGWIDDGWLVKPGSVAKAAPSEDVTALKKALADAEGTVTALTAELDAARTGSADLEAKVAQLTADLEAATKPAA